MSLKNKRFLDFLGPGIIVGYSFAVLLLELDAIHLQTDDPLLRRST